MTKFILWLVEQRLYAIKYSRQTTYRSLSKMFLSYLPINSKSMVNPGGWGTYTVRFFNEYLG